MTKLLELLREQWPALIQGVLDGPSMSEEEAQQVKARAVCHSEFGGVEQRMIRVGRAVVESQAVRSSAWARAHRRMDMGAWARAHGHGCMNMGA